MALVALGISALAGAGGGDTEKASAPRLTGAGATPMQIANGPLPAQSPNRVAIHFHRPPRAGLLFDLRTGQPLWQHDAGRRLPIASLTKMRTGLIVTKRHRPGERVRITRAALAYQGSGIGLLPRGRKVTVGALLDGLMLVSGNDAAIALAQHDAGSVPAFIRRMNQWARSMGLGCTHFSTPNGFLDAGNHSCATDLASLARADLANPTLRRLARTRHVRVRFPIAGGHLELNNNNPLLGEPGVTGLKTGLTDRAGRCYVITAERGRRGLGVVLLNSTNPIAQIHRLLRAGWRARAQSAAALPAADRRAGARSRPSG
ncbi:MAG: hypothetical protein QOJ38_854 [Solirubrobacterales bacterium]|nr:hypothetical protein [Solirubrobacterales bacterium]